jgi:hypothetical protein
VGLPLVVWIEPHVSSLQYRWFDQPMGDRTSLRAVVEALADRAQGPVVVATSEVEVDRVRVALLHSSTPLIAASSTLVREAWRAVWSLAFEGEEVVGFCPSAGQRRFSWIRRHGSACGPRIPSPA